MYCSKCGNQFDNGAQFCPVCGGKQISNIPAESTVNRQSNNSVVQQQPKSIAALVLGIVGLIAWLIPLAGFPITIVGVILSVNGMKSNKSYAKAALIISIIGLVLCIINASIGAFMGANGMFDF